MEVSAAPFESVAHVLLAPQAVMSDLGRSGPDAHQPARGSPNRKAGSQLASQQLGLVESSLSQARRMEGNRHGPRRRQTFDHEALREQQGQRLREAPPALVLEAMNRRFDRALVRDRRTQARQRPQAPPAPTLGARRLHLRPAPAAQRLLEAPDPAPARVAQPRPHGATAAAAGREHKVDQAGEHGFDAIAPVKPAFTSTLGRRADQPIVIWSPGLRSRSAVDPDGSSRTLCAPHSNQTTPHHGGSFG